MGHDVVTYYIPAFKFIRKDSRSGETTSLRFWITKESLYLTSEEVTEWAANASASYAKRFTSDNK